MKVLVIEVTAGTEPRMFNDFKPYAHSLVCDDLQALPPKRPVQVLMQDVDTKYCQ